MTSSMSFSQTYSHPHRSLWLSALVVSLLPSPAIADGEYSQVPAVAPAVVRGMAPAEAPQTLLPEVWMEGPKPDWIWGAEADSQYVLQTTFSSSATRGRLKASCDNVMTLYLNGTQITSSDTWQVPVELDVSRHLVDGENVLVAEVKNQGGISGFVCKLILEGEGADRTFIVSDETWSAADSRSSEEWTAVRTVAAYGDGPWGRILETVVTDSGVPRNTFELLPGFRVEHLFTVPKEELGSWVCITVDPQGRIIASDQGDLGLCRITPPPIGSDEPTLVEQLDVEMTAAQGLLFAFDSLYVSVNGGPGSGLYRLRDNDGDDQFEEVVKLRDFRGGGEHGPHALRLSPDGQSIYVICGNHTRPPFEPEEAADHPEYTSSVPLNWGEDLLLPRQWDANGHAVGILAPGGWIAKTDPNGESWEIVSIGYRNPYDMDFNADGELFAYDADMEWDLGAPWYRPTRVVHATSGSEFGWRSGTGKWPTYYPDSLPQLVDIGPGSPVGVCFGYGTRFPAKYQRALYICDWTFGTMYAIHIEPDGASYTAVKEEFLSRTPLPLTDCVVGTDGALYFSVGGRGTQSELFRVTYVGDESTAPAELHDEADAELRALRQQIEALQGPVEDPRQAVEFLYEHLSHPDRHIRFAARVALEFQPVELWQARIVRAVDPDKLIQGAIALARQGTPEVQPLLIAALQRVNAATLEADDFLDWLRAWQLVFIRLGEPDEVTREALADYFVPMFPVIPFETRADELANGEWSYGVSDATEAANRELCSILVYLQSDQIAELAMPYLQQESQRTTIASDELLARNQGYGGAVASMHANHPDLNQIHFAFVLRNLKAGWTDELRNEYFRWFARAHEWRGGNSFQKFLTNIDNDAWANCTDAERLAIELAGARTPYVPPELPKPAGPGQEWTIEQVLAEAESGLMSGRNFENGQRMYQAARCVVCHRFAGDGGATGPDLTQLAGRFNLKDLTEAILDPSKVISDQYRATMIATTDGLQFTGRIVSETEDAIHLLTDPESSTKVEEISLLEIDERQPSPVSIMPRDLLKTLNRDEVLDLLAYLLSRGDRNDPMFR